MEIFKNLTQIQGAIKFYSSTTKLLIVVFAVAMLGMFFIYFTQNQKTRDSIYILTSQGDVLQAVKGSIKENRKIEAEAHVKLFIMSFFDIDKFNYAQKINQSYDLGSSCIYNLHQKLVKDNWYTNMEQYNIQQTVIIESVECTSTTSPYIVNAKFNIHIVSEATSEIMYTIDMVYHIIEGKERSEKNPHALMIENIEVIDFSEKNTNN